MNPEILNNTNNLIEFIQQAIKNRQYEIAIERTNSFLLNTLQSEDEDHLAYCLEVYDSLCDKSPLTIELTMKYIPELLNNKEYWVRQETLLILRKIFRIADIAKFDPIIELCESKLFDTDKKVRESAIKLLAEVLKKSFDYYPDLYITYSKMFEDTSWRVRAKALEGMLEFLVPTSHPPKRLLQIFQASFSKLIRDPDEEIRGLTTEAVKALGYHLSGQEMVDILLNILNDSDWEIREKGIWIVGEIGDLFFSDFTIIFHRLIDMFSDSIMMVQTKTIDAFVKVGKSKGPGLLQFFRQYIEENDVSRDVLEGITESTIFIVVQNMHEMLPQLIQQLIDSSSKFRDFISDCLIKIYMEKSDVFEEELARMYLGLDPEDWRQRRQTIRILGDLTYILHLPSVAVWTFINLQNYRKEEKDLDVLDEIDISLEKIHNLFEDIDKDVQEIEKQRKEFYQDLENFQTYIQNMREKSERMIKENQFQKAEVFMEEESNRIVEKLNDMETYLNNSEFKRFSMEIVQDFKEIKDEVLENITDVKYIMINRLSEGREKYLDELKDEIQKLTNRINKMNENYKEIEDLENKLHENQNISESTLSEQLLEKISFVRKELYTLEFEIGQLWMQNMEFKEALKEVTLLWVDVKIEVQQYLSSVIYRFKDLERTLEVKATDQNILKKKITFDFLNSNLQRIVLQAIQSLREIKESFDKLIKPIYLEIKKRRFSEARNMVKMTIDNVSNTIEEYNKEIDNIYQKIDSIDLSQINSEELQNYILHWNNIKIELKDILDKFQVDIEEEIFSAEINEYLSYMNPLSLYQLSIVYSIPVKELKTSIFNLLKKHKLFAEIRNNALVQPNKPLGENFIKLHRKVEIIGSKIIFDLRLHNPTKFFLNDLSLIFIHPSFLKLQTNQSDPLELIIHEFEPETSRILRWVFKIEKEREKRYELKRWLLNINYQNPFGKLSSMQKEMEIIL
ncbi:hypothetical protein [Candidatus Harpocratesius sp.]